MPDNQESVGVNVIYPDKFILYLEAKKEQYASKMVLLPQSQNLQNRNFLFAAKIEVFEEIINDIKSMSTRRQQAEEIIKSVQP